jgi:hypothetical protein
MAAGRRRRQRAPKGQVGSENQLGSGGGISGGGSSILG